MRSNPAKLSFGVVQNVLTSKYPPAEPGALIDEPLEAAVGSLTRDPESRRTQYGRAIANLRLAMADSRNITSTYFGFRTVRTNFHFRFCAARRYQRGLYLQYSSYFLSHFIELVLNRSYVFADSNCIPCENCRNHE
jgi:hypothetical protein